MEQQISLRHHGDTDDYYRRHSAVEAALQLVQADCLGAGSENLITHMKLLNEYADLIQASLESK